MKATRILLIFGILFLLANFVIGIYVVPKVRAGNNTTNHQDKHVDALIDRMREAATEEAYIKAGHDIQRYAVAETMIYPGVTTLPFLQAHRTYVKGYENLHGHKVRFETTWMDK